MESSVVHSQGNNLFEVFIEAQKSIPIPFVYQTLTETVGFANGLHELTTGKRSKLPGLQKSTPFLKQRDILLTVCDQSRNAIDFIEIAVCPQPIPYLRQVRILTFPNHVLDTSTAISLNEPLSPGQEKFVYISDPKFSLEPVNDKFHIKYQADDEEEVSYRSVFVFLYNDHFKAEISDIIHFQISVLPR